MARRDPLRLALGALAAALMVAVAAMTQAGFAGNLRYVALPAALVCVLAGAGWVELVRDAGARCGARLGDRRAGPARAGAPFAAADVDKLGFDLDVVRAESELYDRLPPIVAKSGGAEALLRCGPVYAPPFEVQAVAWAMHVHSSQVGIFASPPGTDARRALLRPRPRSPLPGDQQEPALVRRSQLPRRDALT